MLAPATALKLLAPSANRAAGGEDGEGVTVTVTLTVVVETIVLAVSPHSAHGIQVLAVAMKLLDPVPTPAPVIEALGTGDVLVMETTPLLLYVPKLVIAPAPEPLVRAVLEGKVTGVKLLGLPPMLVEDMFLGTVVLPSTPTALYGAGSKPASATPASMEGMLPTIGQVAFDPGGSGSGADAKASFLPYSVSRIDGVVCNFGGGI